MSDLLPAYFTTINDPATVAAVTVLALVIVLVLVGARTAVPWLFHKIARTRSRDTCRRARREPAYPNPGAPTPEGAPPPCASSRSW